MVYSVSEENLNDLESYFTHTKNYLNWSSVFVLPFWLQAWWDIFGMEAEMLLRTVRRNDDIIGIAPLMRKDATAYFLGDTDICDYMDFVIAPGMEKDFFSRLIDDLRNNSIKRLNLAHVRPDSTVLNHLQPFVENNGFQAEVTQEEISLETDLPGDWNDYLASLSGKQRHEVRRKLRRLDEAGQVDYYFSKKTEAVSGNLDLFFRMFTMSRRDKADFLTEQMESFFRLLADRMSEAGLMRFGILKLDSQPVACIMSFDYNDCIYLYNSGYDPKYSHLSTGLLSKVLGIKDSIQRGKKRFDFLKGSEPYKYHLGGREVALYRCFIELK